MTTITESTRPVMEAFLDAAVSIRNAVIDPQGILGGFMGGVTEDIRGLIDKDNR